MCGADFPLKVGELGENAPLGYADEAVRPPGDVPQAGQAYPRSPSPSAYPSDAPAYPAYPADERQPSAVPRCAGLSPAAGLSDQHAVRREPGLSGRHAAAAARRVSSARAV